MDLVLAVVAVFVFTLDCAGNVPVELVQIGFKGEDFEKAGTFEEQVETRAFETAKDFVVTFWLAATPSMDVVTDKFKDVVDADIFDVVVGEEFTATDFEAFET